MMGGYYDWFSSITADFMEFNSNAYNVTWVTVGDRHRPPQLHSVHMQLWQGIIKTSAYCLNIYLQKTAFSSSTGGCCCCTVVHRISMQCHLPGSYIYMPCLGLYNVYCTHFQLICIGIKLDHKDNGLPLKNEAFRTVPLCKQREREGAGSREINPWFQTLSRFLKEHSRLSIYVFGEVRNHSSFLLNTNTVGNYNCRRTINSESLCVTVNAPIIIQCTFTCGTRWILFPICILLDIPFNLIW